MWNYFAVRGVDCRPDSFFLLLLEVPPVRAPNAVDSPAELFQDTLPCTVAGSCNQRTVVSRAVTFDGENVFAALFDNDVEPEFASTVLA